MFFLVRRNAGGSTQVLTTDPDAEFAALVERQSRFVFRVVYAVLLNAYDAEDAVQETFLKLFRSREWQQADNERAFLARVAWRVAVDMRRRSTPLVSSLSETEEEDAPPSALPGPHQILTSSDEHALVHSMIDALPEELRVPLVLSTFEELTSREIGRALGVPDGTVRTRLQRARQMLRQKLEAVQPRRQEILHA
jgi:RNA polymerase sigma-70 factor (ECF subfamily)